MRAMVASKSENGILTRLRSVTQRRGVWGALSGAAGTLLHPVLRRRTRNIWEARLHPPPEPVVWERGERLLVLGPQNLVSHLTPDLRAFLGGPGAAAELDGVAKGDRLFVVQNGAEYLACSYIFFDTTGETRRQIRILGEPRNTPVIGMSYTAPAARGRGLYRRILVEMFRHVAGAGFERAICEVRPDNTPSNKASHAAGMRLHRELSDWALFERLFFQRVRENGRSRWRVVWVGR